jgi:hypothetical protein
MSHPDKIEAGVRERQIMHIGPYEIQTGASSGLNVLLVNAYTKVVRATRPEYACRPAITSPDIK